jgi:nucleoside-diphosphate-sugar epimerase
MKGQSQPPDGRYLENRVTRHIIALVRNKERALERFSAYKGRADLRFLVQDGNDRGELSILDLAHMLVSLHPRKQLEVVLDETAKPSDYLKSKVTRSCPDIFKIRQLGWEPTTSVSEGFKRTIEYYFKTYPITYGT